MSALAWVIGCGDGCGGDDDVTGGGPPGRRGAEGGGDGGAIDAGAIDAGAIDAGPVSAGSGATAGQGGHDDVGGSGGSGGGLAFEWPEELDCLRPNQQTGLGLASLELRGRSAALSDEITLGEYHEEVSAAVPYRGGVVVGARSGFFDIADGEPPQWVAFEPSYAIAYLPGDLDEDGDDDLLTVHDPEGFQESGGRFIQIWERLEQSTADASPLRLRGRIEIAPVVSNGEQAFALADADRDGHLDLVTIELLRPLALVGDGAFGFTHRAAGPTLPARLEGDSLAVRVADVDGDGALDLTAVIRTSEGKPSYAIVLPAAADELFGEPIVTELEHAAAVTRIADVTGDGVLDVALLYWELVDDFPLLIAAGRGDGRFEPSEPFSRVSDTLTLTVIERDGATEIFTMHDKRLMRLRASAQSPVTLEPSAVAVESGRVLSVLPSPSSDGGERARLLLAVPCAPKCDECDGRCLFDRCLACASDGDCAQGVCNATQCVACADASHCDDDAQCAQGQCTRVVSREDGWRAVATTALAGACGIAAGGALRCWGGNWGELPEGEMTALAVSDWQEPGEGYGCAIRASGQLACWATANGPERFELPAGRFREISVRGAHLCAIHDDGTALCALLDGASVEQPRAGTYAQIAAGSHYACGLTTDGAVRCWGCSQPGERCDDDFGKIHPPAGRFDALAVAESHACAVERDSGQLRCWGPRFEQWSSPSEPFVALTATEGGVCALNELGALRCYGPPDWRPRGSAFLAVSADDHALCGLRADGRIECSTSIPP